MSPIRIVPSADGLTTIYLNRPEKHHAIDAAMMDALTEALEASARDDAVRVILLASEGSHFCAGGDLGWMKSQFGAGRDSKIREARRLACMLKTLNDLPKPVIVRVQGDAYGGGLGLMATADIVIAADNTRFALPETRLGLIPAVIGPFIIAKTGGARVREIFITGSRMDAARARSLGLVSHVVPAGELDAIVRREVDTALKASPEAMSRAKQLCRKITAGDLDARIESAIIALADCWDNEETRAGLKAFFDKSPPPWLP